MLAERQQEMNIQSASTSLVILANSRDVAAQTLAERWARHSACLLTPRDLSVAGWRFQPGDILASRAIAAGRPLDAHDIGAVITRLPWVFEHDLGHIVPTDRAYVAAEMNAFLLSWLTALPCPVLNRPTPTCLSGPFWRQEKWVHTAARLGIPVTPVRRQSALWMAPAGFPEPPAEGVTVTIIGQEHCGPVDPMLVKQARCLADVAGVDVLSVQFGGPTPGSCFVSASLWPDITADEVADTLLTYIQKGSPGCP